MTRLSDEERDALLARFRRWLHDKGLPATRQRELIAEIIIRSDDHLSADAVARRLAERGVRIGTATIYRTLELLQSGGFVRAHEFGEGFRRFEAATGRDRHEHLVCARCGRVTEFASERLERILAVIGDEYRFRPDRHRVEIFGTCAECVDRELGGLRR